jgi:prenyltransferase beta subunit
MFAPAIRKGVQFLIKMQSPDGAWRDFALEPGESDSWVTAYVGGCLSRVLLELTTPGHDEALNRAIQWLRGVMRAGGGWGYNGNCPVDSDSTALSVLLLSCSENSLPEMCYDRLLEFQRTDGGFATFERRDPANAWGVSHPDVSPVVLHALLTKLPPDAPAIHWHDSDIPAGPFLRRCQGNSGYRTS